MKAEMKAQINEEHRILRQKLASITDLCPDAGTKRHCAGCPPSSREHCSQFLANVGEDLMAFMVSHFRNEEKLMRDSGLFHRSREACEKHMQDHGDLSEAALRLVKELGDDKPVIQIAGFSHLLKHWLETHISRHDQPMLDLLDKP